MEAQPASLVRCMNCGTLVSIKDCKLFTEVLVCLQCHGVAKTVLERSKEELRMLGTLLEESIRIALMEGKLSLPDGPQSQPSKAAVLRSIIMLVEGRNGQQRQSVDTDNGAGGCRVHGGVPDPGVQQTQGTDIPDAVGGLENRDDDPNGPKLA